MIAHGDSGRARSANVCAPGSSRIQDAKIGEHEPSR
jgi:hypothetical protein